MDRLTKILSASAAGLLLAIAYFLFVLPMGCNDVGGVPSWQRCTSFLDTPAFSVEDLGLDSNFNILMPILVGVLGGFGVAGLIDLSTKPDVATASES